MRGGRDKSSGPASIAGMRRVLEGLPGMERKVLDLRYGLSGGHPTSASDTAETLGLTLRETQEIEKRGLQRLRDVGDQNLMKSILDRLSSQR